MRARELFRTFAVLTTTFSVEAGAEGGWTPEQWTKVRTATEEQFRAMQEFLVGLHEDIQPYPHEVDVEYNLTPLPRDLSKDQIEQGWALLAQAFFMADRWKDKLRVEGDLFLMPNYEWMEIEAQWTSAPAPPHGNILRPPTDEEAKDDRIFHQQKIREGQYQGHLYLTATDQAVQPASGQGTMRIRVPTRFDQVVLDCDQAGTHRRDGQLDVILISCDKEVALVRVRQDFKGNKPDVKVIPMSATGRRLPTALASPMLLFPGGRTLAEVSFAEFRQGPTDEEEIKIVAQGRIGQVRVVQPTAWAERSFEVKATAMPEAQEGLKITAPFRFVSEPYEPDYATLSVDRLRAAATVSMGLQQPTRVQWGPELVVRLPEVANSMFARIRLTSIRLVDETGEPVEFEASSAVPNDHRPRFRISLRDPEDYYSETFTFHRAVGMLEITYPLKAQVLMFDREQTKHGAFLVTFTPHRVLLVAPLREDDPQFASEPSFTSELFTPLRAYDSQGRRLKKLDRGYDHKGEGVREVSQYFWGKVAKVRLTVFDEWTTIQLPFELTPLPALDP